MLRTVGLDIGTLGTRRVSVGRFLGTPVVESNTSTSGSVTTNVRSDSLTFRHINVPHSNRDIQGMVVREELSFSLPFDIEQATWDWIEKDDVASVIVAMNEDIVALRSQVGEYVALDAEPLSLWRACLQAGLQEALVFDFGATHTTICAIKDSSLEWVKVSLRGGQYLTNQLSEKHSLAEEQAEEHKKAIGCEDPCCQKWLEDIVAGAILELPLFCDKVLICGGGAALPGLREQLGKLLGADVELFPLPKPLNAYEHVMAYGAALAGKMRRQRIQLCPVTPKSSDIKIIYAVWILVLLIVGSCDLELRYATLARAQQQHKAAISAAIEEQAPELANTEPSKISEEVEKRLSESQRVSLNSPANYLQTMVNLSQPLNSLQGVEIRTMECKSDNGGQNTIVTLSGLAQSAQMVEELRSGYDKVLTKAELVESRAGANNTTRFTVEGQLRQQ